MSKAGNSSGTKSLPKFGEWDVNNPASGEGFTVIFNTARDEKKNERTNSAGTTSQRPNQNNQDTRRDKRNHNQNQDNKANKWLCCFGRK